MMHALRREVKVFPWFHDSRALSSASRKMRRLAGMLVPVGDAMALPERLRRLLDDDEEQRRLAEAAKTNFEWLSAEDKADRMLAVYEATSKEH
jgi:glycosyltransferase involved in cell wall biosynthesis